jgi:hypothetical protein
MLCGCLIWSRASFAVPAASVALMGILHEVRGTQLFSRPETADAFRLMSEMS